MLSPFWLDFQVTWQAILFLKKCSSSPPLEILYTVYEILWTRDTFFLKKKICLDTFTYIFSFKNSLGIGSKQCKQAAQWLSSYRNISWSLTPMSQDFFVVLSIDSLSHLDLNRVAIHLFLGMQIWVTFGNLFVTLKITFNKLLLLYCYKANTDSLLNHYYCMNDPALPASSLTSSTRRHSLFRLYSYFHQLGPVKNCWSHRDYW